MLTDNLHYVTGIFVTGILEEKDRMAEENDRITEKNVKLKRSLAEKKFG